MGDGTIREYGQITGHPHDAASAATSAKSLQSQTPAVGDLKHYSDGRSYVACSTDADFTAGEMVATPDFNVAEFANSLTAAAIGAVEITIATTGTAMFGGSAGVLAKDRLADGYIHMTDEAGEGMMYRIVSNAAATATAALVITIEDPGLKVAVTAATDCVITGPRFRAVIQCTAALKAIGAVQRPTLASSNGVTEIVWVQFSGPATVQSSAGVTAGSPVATAAGGQVADTAEAGSGDYDTVVGSAIATTGNGSAAILLSVRGMPTTK